jgi:undecaprenyl-phosphate 4-deoxy-4-formamido-L-arabinose transferase
MTIIKNTYQPEISVIVPVYNSHNTLIELNHRLHTTLLQTHKEFEVIFVDDYSVDKSWEILKEIKINHPETVKIIRLSKNFGQHQATLCGLSYAYGSYVITIDDDLEQEPEVIPTFLQSHINSKATVSYYIYKNKKNKIRNTLTSAFKFLARLDGKVNKGSSFRILNKNLVDTINKNNQTFVYIDELILWYISPEKINFIEVDPPETLKKQQSRYSALSLFKMALYLILYSTTLPLRAVTIIGFFTAFVNLLIGIYFIFRKLFFNVPLGYTSIIVSILFSSGIILMAIGILGIYINRLFLSANHSPVYNVDEEQC